MMITATPAHQEKQQYKPKTAFVKADEIVEPGEFYFLHADSFLLRGKVRKHEDLIMRRGCLAEDGDLVQLAEKPVTIDNIVFYQSGIKYTAVCVMKGCATDLLNKISVYDDKEWWHVEYTVNGVNKYSPWFSSFTTAIKAEAILRAKYGDNLGTYRSTRPGNKTTNPPWRPEKPHKRAHS